MDVDVDVESWTSSIPVTMVNRGRGMLDDPVVLGGFSLQ